MWRYFIWLAAIVGLIIVLVILILPGSKKAPTPRGIDQYSNTETIVRLTIKGPVVSDQKYESIQISVGKDSVTYEELKGYKGQVANLQSYANNDVAYNVFLHALAHTGFTVGDRSSKFSDEKGYCSQGDTYVYEIIDNNTDIQRFWSSTCGNPQTYGGNVGVTNSLFQAQVPDYSSLTNSIHL